MKNLKKLLAALLIAVMGLTIAIPAMAAAPAIKKVEYEGSGKVEVEFTRENVRYKSAKVRVMDEDGEEYSAKIREKDKEDMTFKVSDIKAGKKYAFQISGVRAGASGSYGTVTGYFEVPAEKTSGTAPSIEKVEYEGSGKVEVEFTRENVRYKSAKVKVMDEDGKEYSAKIREKDRGDLTFKVSDIKAGKKYAFQISGVRAGTSGSYGAVTGYFNVPAAKAVAIEKVDYDHEDRELEIDFEGRVEYKSLKVRVKDEVGKSYSVKVRDKDDDSIEVRVSGLTYGEKYAVQVSGVRSDGSDGDYEAVVKVFTAR